MELFGKSQYFSRLSGYKLGIIFANTWTNMEDRRAKMIEKERELISSLQLLHKRTWLLKASPGCLEPMHSFFLLFLQRLKMIFILLKAESWWRRVRLLGSGSFLFLANSAPLSPLWRSLPWLFQVDLGVAFILGYIPKLQGCTNKRSTRMGAGLCLNNLRVSVQCLACSRGSGIPTKCTNRS